MVTSQQIIVSRRGTDAGWDTGVSAKYLVYVYVGIIGTPVTQY
jgi:hypothetical protein